MTILMMSSSGTINNTLKFVVKEIDPQTGEADDTGYDDEYQVRGIPSDKESLTYFLLLGRRSRTYYQRLHTKDIRYQL